MSDTGPDTKPETLWYFAYGSNMSSGKFTGSRGIVPLDTARVCIPHWEMVMEIPGLPYSEPSFSSLRPRDPSCAEYARIPDVIGVAYLITAEQYRSIIASEGGGTAYADFEIAGEGLTEKDQNKLENGKAMRTLRSSDMTRFPPPAPSVRYLNLLLDGAVEAQLPREYRSYLQSIPTYSPPLNWWMRLGASLFLAVWGPVMGLLEKITTSSIGPDGNAPQYVVWLVRFTMAVIWFVHDWLFAPIFGPGDGRGRKMQSFSVIDEKTPLIGAVYSEKQDVNV